MGLDCVKMCEDGACDWRRCLWSSLAERWGGPSLPGLSLSALAQPPPSSGGPAAGCPDQGGQLGFAIGRGRDGGGAVVSGTNLKVVEWLWAEGCPWGTRACSDAGPKERLSFLFSFFFSAACRIEHQAAFASATPAAPGEGNQMTAQGVEGVQGSFWLLRPAPTAAS